MVVKRKRNEKRDEQSMMRNGFLALSLCFGAAACAPQVPDSAAGVGFDSYDSYQDQREAELSGSRQPVAPTEPVVGSETAGNVAVPTTTATASAGSAVDLDNPGISDEQNFDAVSSRESIESDAARIQQNRQAYVVVQPTALPTRPSDGRPNIVAFALATNNPVGTQLYDRGATSTSRFQRACGRYPSSDLAQEDFLANGGPERDRAGMDPDGDGFACFWDPTPFRAARGG